MTLQAHPLADLFPMIEGPEFEAFAQNIKAHGQRNKIVLLDGLILDGRNRYAAAVLHDLPAAQGDADCFRDFDPATEGDPLQWVLSQNLERRHMNEGQRSMVAERLVTMRQGERSDLEHSANLPKVDQEDAAAALKVSVRSLRSAKNVRANGSPELIKLVEQGKMAVSLAEKAAKQDPATQARIVAMTEEGKANAVRTAIKQGERAIREADLGAKQKALPDKKFGIILADPEHRFEVYSRETGLDRAADNHYPTSEQRLLMMREVPKISAKDCMCVLWVTDLARGLRMLESWGFAFKSYLVWAKDIVEGPRNEKGQRTYVEVGPAGMGYWFRDRDELVLIGTRGNFVAPAMGTQPESILFAARPKIEGQQRGKHSAKPEGVHLWIEANWPNTPKIELNARQTRAGWDTWGNETPAPAEPEDENQDRFETEFNQDSIPKPATEAAAATGREPHAPKGAHDGAFSTDGAEAGEKCSAPEPTPQTSVTGVTGGERAAPDPKQLAADIGTGPRWANRVVKAVDSFEIPAFLLRKKPEAAE